MRKFLRPLGVVDLARPLLNTAAKLNYLLISRFFRALRLVDEVSGI